MAKYALVNNFNATSNTFGTIISRHNSVDAANKADDAYQRAVKRANGSNSYIPTVVVERTVGDKVARGSYAPRSQYKAVDRYGDE
jgi:hypothetical protein